MIYSFCTFSVLTAWQTARPHLIVSMTCFHIHAIELPESTLIDSNSSNQQTEAAQLRSSMLLQLSCAGGDRLRQLSATNTANARAHHHLKEFDSLVDKREKFLRNPRRKKNICTTCNLDQQRPVLLFFADSASTVFERCCLLLFPLSGTSTSGA